MSLSSAALTVSHLCRLEVVSAVGFRSSSNPRQRQLEQQQRIQNARAAKPTGRSNESSYYNSNKSSFGSSNSNGVGL